MKPPLPLLLVPGLLCSARLFVPQISALWPHGPIGVADHRRDDTIAAIATRILAYAPARFALCGLSMGGYIAFEIVRQAPNRVARLALLDTSARPETEQQTAMRREQIALAQGGRFGEIPALSMPRYVHPDRQDDPVLIAVVKAMADDTGADAFVRQQQAIMTRADSRHTLATIRCPTLVLVGDSDMATPPDHAQEMTSGIAGASLVVVPDCGHLSTLEQPEAVNAALSDWLSAT